MSGDKLRASNVQPFGTADDYLPDAREIAGQVGALSSQVTAMDGHLNRLGAQMSALATHVTDAAKESAEHARSVHADIALLRAKVTDVEAKSTLAKVGGGAKTVANLTAYLVLAQVVLNGLSHRWPWLKPIADGLKGISL